MQSLRSNKLEKMGHISIYICRSNRPNPLTDIFV